MNIKFWLIQLTEFTFHDVHNIAIHIIYVLSMFQKHYNKIICSNMNIYMLLIKYYYQLVYILPKISNAFIFR